MQVRARLAATVILLLCFTLRTASAQSQLVITLNGPNPQVLECHVDRYVEFGVTVTGASGSYTVTVTSNVNPDRVGTYSVVYVATDSQGRTATAIRTVVVRDTIPPSVLATTNLQLLWPPNHNLVNVGLRATVRDLCDPSPTIAVNVFGDEDDEEATGDGRHAPDARNIALRTLRLRSERKGNADGRVYLVVVTATDASRNVGFHAVAVVVPHDKSRKSVASAIAQGVAAQLRAAEFVRYLLGALPLPTRFFVIGDGPIIGPKQ